MKERKWSRPYLAVLGAPAIGEACANCGRPIAVGEWFRYTKGKDHMLPRGHLWRHVECAQPLSSRPAKEENAS